MLGASDIASQKTAKATHAHSVCVEQYTERSGERNTCREQWEPRSGGGWLDVNRLMRRGYARNDADRFFGGVRERERFRLLDFLLLEDERERDGERRPTHTHTTCEHTKKATQLVHAHVCVPKEILHARAVGVV